MYVVLLRSWATALTGGRLRWQKLRRTGVVEAPGAIPQQRTGERGGSDHLGDSGNYSGSGAGSERRPVG
jgi:hypothetical protein